MQMFNRYEYNPQTDIAGRGEFSRVYKAVDTTNHETVAVKIYKINDLSVHYHTVKNIATIKTLDHPGLCRYYDIREIEKEDSFGEKEILQVCVTSFMNAGSLVNFCRPGDPSMLGKLLPDVLNALAYLHKKEIIHGYIKPSNILVTATNAAIAAGITDYAMGIWAAGDLPASSGSHPLLSAVCYSSPEQVNAKHYGINGKISFNTDIWSLGVVVYEALTGEPLFTIAGNDFADTIAAKISSFELPEKIDSLPEPFAAFLKLCLVKNASERVKNAADLLALFQQEYNTPDNLPELDKPSAAAATAEELPDPGTMQDNQQAEDTRIIVLPEKDDTAVAGLPISDNAGDDTQVIARPVADTGAGKEERQADEDTKIILQPPNAFLPFNGGTMGGDEVTRFIAGPAAAGDANKADPHSNEDTRIISSPSEKSLAADSTSADDDATRFIAGPVNAGVASPATPPDSASPDETIIITKLNKEKQTPQNQGKDAAARNPGGAGLPEDEAKQPDVIIRRREKPVMLFNRYEYLPASDLIGKGGFSRVYKAYDKKLSRWVALKIYKTGEFSDRYSPIAEIKRVVNLDHPNICRYLDIEEIENENPFGENEKIQVCVMELLDSGNFADYYQANKNPETLKKLIQDILNGLSYLHKNGIIHRDIKPANILIKKTIEGPVAKITDFGISKNSDTENNNSSSALIVSIPYMAPEQLNAKKYGINEKVSFNLDLWSLGVTIYEVFTGKVLFKNSDQDNSEQIMANIMAPELPEKLNDLPEPFRTIVSHCVIKNARERASRAEELMVLLHAIPKPADTSAMLASQAANASPGTNKESIIPQVITENIQTKPAMSTTLFPLAPEDKMKASRFVVTDAEEKFAAVPIKEEKKKNYLLIFLSIAVALFILFIVFLKTSNPLPPVTNTVGPRKQDTVRKTITTIPATDTARKAIAAPEQHTDTAATAVEKPAHAHEKKTAQPTEEPHKKEPAHTAKTTGNTASKYVLLLSAETACTLQVNTIAYGEIKNGVPLRIYLTTGKYILQFTSSSNSASTYTATIEVKPENLGHADKFKIPLK